MVLAISRASTPSFRKSAVRPKDVIKRLLAKVSCYRKAITRLQKQKQKAPQTATEALAMIRPHVTEEVFQLVSSHVKLRSKGRGKRFPLWLKKFALHLNFCGPQAYRFLSAHFNVPSRRSLRRCLFIIKMTPGFIPGIMSSISTKTQSWNARDRVCILVFDEMALKKNLAYDVTQDVVQGFTDDFIERTSEPWLSYSLVFLRGGFSLSPTLLGIHRRHRPYFVTC